MKGGGYDSNLSLNSGTILSILRTNQHDNSRITFTITNIETNERKEYVNIRCLGQGTYGKVFLVENDEHENYVIKITDKYIDTLYNNHKNENSLLYIVGNKSDLKN